MFYSYGMSSGMFYICNTGRYILVHYNEPNLELSFEWWKTLGCMNTKQVSASIWISFGWVLLVCALKLHAIQDYCITIGNIGTHSSSCCQPVIIKVATLFIITIKTLSQFKTYHISVKLW